MKISSDAQAVINNAGSGAMNYIQSQGGFGGKLTSGEATRLLTGFNPTITPQQVYSASNIQQASTNPAPAPNYSDPFALRDYFLNTPDIVAARTNAQQVQQDLMRARQTGRSQQQAIQELPQALNVIRGEQAVAGQQSALTEQALSENLLATQSAYDALRQEGLARYDIANTQRNDLRSLITATKGKAGISYADSYETALQKAAKWEKKTNEEAAKLAKKEAEKTELKKLALAAGISTKGKNSKEIRKALEKKAKKDSSLNDEMNKLKLDAARLEIANTKSIIANRNSEGQKTSEINVDKSDNGIKKLVDEAINSGESWDTIAQTLTGAGINTVRDSIADKYLRYKLNNEFKGKNGKFKP